MVFLRQYLRKFAGRACATAVLFLPAAVLFLPAAAPAQSSFFDPDNPPTADQAVGEAISAVEFGPDQVCLSLSRCLEILDTHAPDSFDYALLAADFDRFGMEAQSTLVARVLTPIKNEAAANDANRALHVLARLRGLLSPGAQRGMVALWRDLPEDSPLHIDDLSTVLTHHISPMVRAAAIDGLASPRADVRLASQIMLTRLAVSDLRFPLRDDDVQKLARSLKAHPHPGVVAVLAKDTTPAVNPILAATLMSGDAGATQMAYQALYDRDREEAFRALVATLYGLKDSDSRAALALADMLRARHALRDDGFYLTFARDLAEDPKMSAIGRMAGFDALLRAGEAVGDTPQSRSAYTRALSAYADAGSIPPAYFEALSALNPKSLDSWLSPLAAAARRSAVKDRLSLIHYAGRYDSPLSYSIAEAAIRERSNHRVLMAGIIARTAQAKSGDKAPLLALMDNLENNHPITDVRGTAALASKALATKDPRAALARLGAPSNVSLNKGARFCKFKAEDFSQAAKQMPYFGGGALISGAPALRGWLRTAARVKGGWLAGYASPRSGALLLFDTASETATEIMPAHAPAAHHAVRAIVPLKDARLGQTASDFWIIAGQGEDAAIYRLTLGGRGLSMRYAASLPLTPMAISRSSDDGGDGGVIMGFGTAHPPLSLRANTGLTRHCNTGTKAQSSLLP